MEGNNHATLGVTTAMGTEEQGRLPTWAIILIVVVIAVVVIVVLYLLVRNAARVNQKRAQAGVRDNTLDGLMRERQRLLSSPSQI